MFNKYTLLIQNLLLLATYPEIRDNIIHMVAILKKKKCYYFNVVYFRKSAGEENSLTVVVQINIHFRCVKNFHLSTRNTI
jgi:hypothetical protein